MKKNLRTKFVGMDVHQKSISIAIADDGAVFLIKYVGNCIALIEQRTG